MSSSRAARSRSSEREALFVRIPTADAQRLDRAAFELKRSKQDLVTALVARYVDPASPASLAALRALGEDDRRITIESGHDQLAIGHHDFRPTPPPDVLTLADAAALLQVEEEVVERLAQDGELPARRVGDAWRLHRQAVLDWLAAGAS